MWAVIRVKGLVKVDRKIKHTLAMLRLNRKMHCILLQENPVNKGMLTKVKDKVTWGEIDDDILKLMIKKRGRKPGNIRLEQKEADDAFDKIKSGVKAKDLEIKPVFRLSPPSKGFKKSIKQHYPKGELGYRKEKINDLLKRMI